MNYKDKAPFPEDLEGEHSGNPLSAEEAHRLRERIRGVSPRSVIGAQAVVGLAGGLVAWALTGQQSTGWSVVYGALTVLLPAAVFARGLTGRIASANASAAGVGFLVWELVKIILTLAMLMAAPKVVAGLSWLALLVGLVLAMKVYWLALTWAPKLRK